MNQTTELLKRHASIRKYQNRPVGRELVDEIVRCAQSAPTSSHFQAYTVIEVADPARRAALQEASGGQEWVGTAPLLLLFCGDLHRGARYYELDSADMLHNTEFYTVAAIDAALAAQNAMVAAESLGLGGVFVGGIRNDVDALYKTFSLPDLVFPLFVLCIGYPEQEPGPKPRLPREIVLKRNFYDETGDEERIRQYNETVSRYYHERTGGKSSARWTQHCAGLIAKKTREDVGPRFRKAGLAQR